MNERDIVNDIRQVLDNSLERMDADIRARLHAARRGVLNPARPREERGGVLALARHHHRLALLLLAGGLLLAAWLASRPQPAANDVELDIMLLTDDIPPQIYADWRLVRREDVGPLCLTVN